MSPPKLKLVSARLHSGCVVRAGSWRLDERLCNPRGASRERPATEARPHQSRDGAVSRRFDHARPLRMAGRRD